MKVILNASEQPYINIGIRYGGVKIDGLEYIYHPARDAFIRKDLTKKMRGKSWEQFLEFINTVE